MPFVARPADVEEAAEGDAAAVARENAVRKALAADASGDELVLGVDTVVALDGVLHGKPADAAEARRVLTALGGRTHDVVSAVALRRGAGPPRVAIARTRVTFRTLDAGLLDLYVGSREWRGRAGAYAIQGRGAALVQRIEGDYLNVVGLPVAALLDLEPGLVEDAR